MIGYNLLALPALFLFSHFLALLPAKSGSLQKVRAGVLGRKHWFEDLRAEFQNISPSRPRVWVHAASMGECEQAKPILRELGERFPEYVRVLTIFSPSAYRHLARQNFPAEVLCYLPFDSLRQVNKFYNLVQPRAGIVIRHDYWPNFMWQAQRRNIFLILADANVSANAKSFRHKPLVRHFNREILSHFDVIAAVSPSAADNLQPLLRYPERLCILGDTRFEQVLYRVQSAAPRNLLPHSWRGKEILLVAGSTWPSDEEVIIPAFAAVQRKHEALGMILVPHEPTAVHLQNAEQLLQQCGLASVRLSLAQAANDANVLLVDRIGVLAELYGAGNIAFVGGGFGPGVHSVLEAAAHGVPVLFGPRHNNSTEAMEMARMGIGKIIRNEKDGEQELLQLMQNESETGNPCRTYVEQKTGAARALVALLEPCFRSEK